MPSAGFRKFTITLTIVVIVAHPSCGFILHRRTTAEAIPGPTTDLDTQGSLHVQSLKRPNDIRPNKDADTNKTMKTKNGFSNELKFIDSTEDPSLSNTKEIEITVYTAVTDVATSQDIITKENEESKLAGTNQAETTTQGIQTTAGDDFTLSKRTVTLNNVSTEKITGNVHKTELMNNSDASTIANMELTEAEQNYTELQSIRTSSTIESKNEDEVKSTVDVTTVNDQIAIDSEPTENLLAQKEAVTNTTTANIRETETEISIETSTTPIASSEINEKPNFTPSEATTALWSKSDFTTNNLNLELSESPNDMSKSASTIVEVRVTEDSSIITTEPTWKKYITIERKRIGSSEETSSRIEKDQDLAKAESIQTTLPIPSIEMLREDLSANVNHLSTVREPQTGSSVTAEVESVPTSESIESTQSETLGTVASKRAGFLNLSRTSKHYEETTTDKNSNHKTYKIEATDKETKEIKKINVYESQSQLAEDAIKEELLKEEIISNHEENAKRYDVDKPLVDSAKSADSTNSQAIIDDNLSVQPINQDRRTTLYTVGPNYKPMKRIEVQPAKPFVRDPDDNSWRNESISSLGIVFNPKNSSSKSFKEVLKTKTESELNNLQEEKDNKDTPELRERLEKIAEVRKSKKKRIDKFGEVVYTDYEEGSSAEGTNTPKAETTSTEAYSTELPSTLSSKTPETEVTSPMPTTDNQSYWKSKLETISKEEMFKDLGLDYLTTAKPKKPYNLAEYYDTTDEYDADYVTLPKIDLKKFTIPFKPLTPPPMLPPTTRIMPPRFPERKPTVQYFPPTTKPQKVNMNDYDVDFERRVRLFTLKDIPKTMSPVDMASDPVATDRPNIRPTVRTSDFTMLTPASPESLNEHVYMTNEPRVTEPQNFVITDGNFNRGTYVIKHYRDFLSDAAKEEDERSPDFIPYTEGPPRGVTLDELARVTEKVKTAETDYDYDSQFRKKVLSRFVDNFNQNSDRFKVDFPVLFNTSVVHRSNDEQGRVLASSSTFIKRLYGNEPIATKPPKSSVTNRGCEPNCDRITVELAPAYELHYYVPEQEEKEEADQRPATLPYRYKL